MMRGLRHFLRNQSGAAAAEMAMILPVALALIVTTFEGSYYLLCEHRVIKGVRDAARYAARLDRGQYACSGGPSAATTATIKNLARTGQLSGGTAQVPGWVDGNVTVRVTCTTLGTTNSLGTTDAGIYNTTSGIAPIVSVSTRLNYPSIMGAMGFTQATIEIGAAAQSPVIGI